MKPTTLIALAGLLAAGCSAHAASFDCKKAQTRVEKMICADAELSKLDEELATTYSATLKDNEKATRLRLAQKDWLRERNVCPSSTCLVRSYRLRITSLKASTLAPFTFTQNESLPEQSKTQVCKDFKNYLNNPRSNELFKPDGTLVRESDLFKSVIWETLDKEQYRDSFTANLEIPHPKPYPEWGVVREWLRRYASPNWALQRTLAYPFEHMPKQAQRQRWIFRLVNLQPYTRNMVDPKSKVELPTWFHFGDYGFLGYEDGSPLVGNTNYLVRKTPREWITYAGYTYAVINGTFGSEKGAVPTALSIEIDQLSVDPNGQSFLHFTCAFRAKNSQ